MEVGLSDCRCLFLYINITKFLCNTFVDKTNISSRKIGTSSPFNIKEYKGTVKIHMNRRIFSDNRETKKQIKESTLTIKDMKHIQYIDKHITEIILFTENKLRNKKDKDQWSPSFGRAHALVSYLRIALTQLRIGCDQLHWLDCLKKKIKNEFLGKWTSPTNVL